MNKKIGIWGLGVVGNSAVNYLNKDNNKLTILDKTEPSLEILENLKQKNINFYIQNINLEKFLEENDQILASPGIDLKQFSNYKQKWITEVDLFQEEWKSQ